MFKIAFLNFYEVVDGVGVGNWFVWGVGAGVGVWEILNLIFAKNGKALGGWVGANFV